MYVFGCRKKACRRKEGSVRALRAVRTSEVKKARGKENGDAEAAKDTPQPAINLGETLFGVKSPTPTQANPFASGPGAGQANANPFATTKPEQEPEDAKETSTVDNLAQTFAQKASINAAEPAPIPSTPLELWREDESPYPSYHVDADKEYLEAETEEVPSNARLDNSSEGGSSSTADDNKAAFESSMDRTFQRFADRLSQNPEQVLRYEFGGQPLLYAKDDKVGKLLAVADANGGSKVQTVATASGSKMPRCANCGAGRVFEMQLTPHLITELEADEMSVDGMDWGTVVVGSCGEDCQEKGKGVGEVGYVEEWVGVQWEELATSKKK